MAMPGPQAEPKPSGGVVRLFIALPVDDAVKNAMADWQRRLKPAFERGMVSWTNPVGIHLTLKFLGNTPEERIAGLAAHLAPRLRNFGPVTLRAAGTGVFPHPAKPRVLYAATRVIDGDLTGLAAAVEAGCRDYGFGAGDKAFRPHLTLARLKRMNHRHLENMQLSETAPDFGQWTASGVVLYSSKLTPAGARYAAVHRWALDSSPNHG